MIENLENNEFILVRVEEDYIEYLRNFDNKVQINSSKYDKDNKPFLGVLFKINGLEYFSPISSNKKSKLQIMFNTYIETNKKPIDMFFIEDLKKSERTLLSILNINNMIPVPKEAIIYFDITNDKDFSLLRKEIDYCKRNKEHIIKSAIRIYKAVRNHTWDSLEKRCCNYTLLEEKCKDYSIQKKIENEEKEIKDKRVKEILPQLNYIKDVEDLYYIYNNLNNQDVFEDTVRELDTKENSINIQSMTKDDINDVLSRQIDNEMTKNNIDTLFDGNEEPE